MKKLIVFTGPTLSGHDPTVWDDVELRPPASQGDVLRASAERPWAIGLVDGYFEWVPAVWHKEILWAMSRGVRVYGSASIGALRACELAAFGMRGVGRIHRQFVDGTLEDDDEVTLVHATAEHGYAAASEPMVNIRWTLAAAVADGVVSADTAEALVRHAKSRYYPDRSIDEIVRFGRAHLAPDEMARLVGWLPVGYVDQKRRDAEAMVAQMITDRAREGDTPADAAFRFQHTDAWDQVLRQVDRSGPTTGNGRASHDLLLDELRLQPELHHDVRTEATIAALAEWASGTEPGAPSAATLEEAVDRFWARQGEGDDRDLDAWLIRHRLNEHDLVRLIEREADVRRVRTIVDAGLDRSIVDVLALGGHRGALLDRAERKHTALERRGLANPTLDQAGTGEMDLWHWFFVERLGREVPDDLARAAREFGYEGAAAFRRAVLREYCWLRLDESHVTRSGR